ncbi:MAG: hypothetical protein A2Z83_04245 [Omnitrophica bacterium GWA2_52_8]|nr:MAG: hypothetical protein A2Z83_04245 [Omnitrophica bacterium GWA2_52_8]
MTRPVFFGRLRKDFRKLGSRGQARLSARFFKTAPGQYGYGDVFLGISVPAVRGFAGKCGHLSGREILTLLRSPLHEERLLALIIWTGRFSKSSAAGQKEIFTLYLKNVRRVNNWDLVDASAPAIAGGYLLSRKKNVLFRLARAASLWERRIAIVSTLTFIRSGRFKETFQIARLLFSDAEDLIHKAVGWMLRETVKKDGTAGRRFLNQHAHRMPRTSLRYAIERFSEAERKRYLGMKQT